MPISVIETYPGQNLSVFQLLHAARVKLHGVAFCGRFVEGLSGCVRPSTQLQLLQDSDDP